MPLVTPAVLKQEVTVPTAPVSGHRKDCFKQIPAWTCLHTHVRCVCVQNAHPFHRLLTHAPRVCAVVSGHPGRRSAGFPRPLLAALRRRGTPPAVPAFHGGTGESARTLGSGRAGSRA